MLFQLGPVPFEVQPFNTHQVEDTAPAEFVEKPVLGVRPPIEFVGPGGETKSFDGRLFPLKFGGLATMAVLHQLRVSGVPQYLVRGDGEVMGWWAIENVQETSTYLGADGVGQVVEFRIDLRLGERPSPEDYYDAAAEV